MGVVGVAVAGVAVAGVAVADIAGAGVAVAGIAVAGIGVAGDALFAACKRFQPRRRLAARRFLRIAFSVSSNRTTVQGMLPAERYGR